MLNQLNQFAITDAHVVSLLSKPLVEVIHAVIDLLHRHVEFLRPSLAVNHAPLEIVLVVLYLLSKVLHNGKLSASVIHLATQLLAEVFELLQHRVLIGVVY